MKFKHFILPVILIFIFSPVLYGQEEDYDSLLIREIIVENPVYKPVIGFGAGITNFYGDVKNFYVNPFVGNYAFKLSVSAFIDPKKYFAGSFFFLLGNLTGNESSYQYLDRNLNFRSDIYVIGLNVEYNFGHIFRKEDRILMPFLSVGIENISFSSKGDLRNGSGIEYNYWSDGTLRDISESDKDILPNNLLYRDWTFETDLRDLNLYGLSSYSQNVFALPVDAGIDLQVSKRVKMRLGTSVHFTFTDLIDNVSWENDPNWPDNPGKVMGKKGNDLFTFTYLTMHLDLFSEPKVRYEELYFAELGDFDYTMFDDEDADGVIDATDECPKTLFGTPVDTLGCPLDGDADGVPDYLDKETGTVPGSYVDDDGVTLSEDQLIDMLSLKEAVRRSDLALYSLTFEEGSKLSLNDLPEKFQQLDSDGDQYLSFDELLTAIDRFFDYQLELTTEEIYRVINFFFLQ